MNTVLFVETGSGFGGSAVCLASLIRYLDRSLYRPMVAHTAEGLAIKRIRRQGVETVALHPGRAWWELTRLIVRRRVDLVHANNELYSHCATILAARATGRPCIVHMRGIRGLTRMERGLIRLVSHFLIISAIGHRHYLNEGLPAQRSSVLYDGVDVEVFNGRVDPEAARREFGFGRDEVVFGIVSRLVPMKGHRDFLEAVALASRRCPAIRAVIVGGDPQPDQSCLRELQAGAQELGLGGRVVFTGWRDDIPAVTAAFDVAVQASRYLEGFGTSVMEAMALGKPVVATAVGGIPELAQQGETALLVPPGDPQAMAEAIVRLAFNAAERSRLGDAGRQRVTQLFDQRRLAKQQEMVYRSVLNGRSAQR